MAPLTKHFATLTYILPWSSFLNFKMSHSFVQTVALNVKTNPWEVLRQSDMNSQCAAKWPDWLQTQSQSIFNWMGKHQEAGSVKCKFTFQNGEQRAMAESTHSCWSKIFLVPGTKYIKRCDVQSALCFSFCVQSVLLCGHNVSKWKECFHVQS